jgi:hypothetical protein
MKTLTHTQAMATSRSSEAWLMVLLSIIMLMCAAKAVIHKTHACAKQPASIFAQVDCIDTTCSQRQGADDCNAIMQVSVHSRISSS